MEIVVNVIEQYKKKNKYLCENENLKIIKIK